MPRTSVENSSDQPSSIIKSRILKGVEIMEGGSITMPMLIRVEETMMSMSRKGIYSRNPIRNAAFSYEVT